MRLPSAATSSAILLSHTVVERRMPKQTWPDVRTTFGTMPTTYTRQHELFTHIAAVLSKRSEGTGSRA
jgi:hypothetical protein